MPILPLLLPARRSVLPALLAAAILATAPVATALPIEILSAFQSVDAEAEALQGFQRSAQQRADGDDGAASADFAVDALAAIASAGAAASALLETQLTDRLLAGSGAASAEAGIESAEALALGRAASFVRIVFRVATDAPFSLVADLASGGSGASVLGAFFSLTSLDAGLDPLAFVWDGAGGDASGVLLAGVDYELLAVADALAEAFAGEAASSAGASFSFRLLVVPEPATAAGLVLGLALLAARRRAA